MDEDATSGKAFVERVANRIALNMARAGKARDGEGQEAMAERLREEILSRSAFAEQETEAVKEAPKETPKDEPKPKKTGYTYDDVHGMMDAVKKMKGSLFPFPPNYMQNYTKCKFCIIKGSEIGNFEAFEPPRTYVAPFGVL
jgi:hypothetical protein